VDETFSLSSEAFFELVDAAVGEYSF